MMQMISTGRHECPSDIQISEWSCVVEDRCGDLCERHGFMLCEIIKLGSTSRSRSRIDACSIMYPNKTECVLHLRSGRDLRLRRASMGGKCEHTTRRHVGIQTTMTTATMTRTATMMVKINANGLCVRDEFRIMFLVYDRVRGGARLINIY